MTTSIITRGSGVSIAGRQPRGVSPAFSRASFAFQSDGRLVGVGVPRFETVGGRRGVLVEEGTTNLIAASGSGVNLTTWGGLYTVTKTIEGDWYRIAFDPSRANSGIRGYVNLAALTNNAAYVCSVDLRNDGDKSVTIHLDWCDGGSKVITVEPGQTVRAATSPYAQEYTSVYRFFDVVKTSAGGSILMRFPQVEHKVYATSFVDGIRANETLILPIQHITPQEGTVEIWCKLPELTRFTGGSWRRIFGIADNQTTGMYALYYYPSTKLLTFVVVETNTAYTLHVNPPTAGWHHMAARWTSSSMALFIDGELAKQRNDVVLPSAFAFDVMALGGRTDGGDVLDACFCNLHLHRRALTAEEIAAHAAGNIVASDCCHYPFDGDLWPAPGSLGAVVAPSIITRPGSLEVIRR